jgi:WD40 repeat protein
MQENSAGPKVSRLLYDAYHLVLDYHQAIEVSAVQIYHSALVFIPNCSLLRAYEHELPAIRMTTPRTNDWDATLLVFEGHKNPVNMVSISYEKSRVASASDDGHVRIWDTFNGGQVSCLEGHDGPVRSVDYSSDSSRIVSGGSDMTIRVWDATTGFNICTLTGHTGAVNSVLYTSDGRNIVSGSDDASVRIWDALGNKHLVSLNGHSGAVTCLAFLVDDSRVLSGGMDSTICLWDMKTATAVKVIQCADAVLCLAVSPSREKPVFLSGSQDGAIAIRATNTLEEAGGFVGHTAGVKSVAFGVLGRKVVSGSADGTIRVWNATDKRCVAEYRGHSGPVECTRFTLDGACILSASADRSVRMWDAKIEGIHGSKDYIMTVKIPDDVEHIVSGSTNGKVALWKTSDSIPVYEVDAHRGMVYCVALSHDDKYIASASADQTICIFNLRDGTNFATFQGHTDEVYTVDFSSDTSLLVSSSKDGHVKIWDVHAKKLKRSFTPKGGVGVASFSPDGKLICTGAFDEGIHIWNTETGDEVAVLNEYPSGCLWVLFSPDGKWLASWFEDEAVKVWRVEGTKFEPSPHKEWRIDRQANTITFGEGVEWPEYDEISPSYKRHYLQEDGWIIFPRTGKRVCWVPPSRRQPWLRTLWWNRKGVFVTGSQAGGLTIIDLRSTIQYEFASKLLL